MRLQDGLQIRATVRKNYLHRVETGAVRRDEAQLVIADRLDRLIDEIAQKRLTRKSSALGWLFAKRQEKKATIRGLYIHGGVGRGKTMLMDMFFDMVPARKKRRAHFNDFMADVQDRIQKHRQARLAGSTSEDDPIAPVARALAEEAWVLCFDEFAVTDIADAMILSRLFSALFEQGVVLVATSNVAPQNLYHNGLNRQLFLPFIAILERHAEVLSLDIGTDYRLEKLNSLPVYITPADASADAALDSAWEMMTEGQISQPASIALKGRSIKIPCAAGDAARFNFADLCEKPLGARDYLAIATHYSTIFIDHVPVLDETRRNEAKRFILLIDVIYDQKLRLVLSAAAPPTRLYTGRNGTEAFEFDRTISRLIEMQSHDWRDMWANRKTTPEKNADKNP
ncbi:cell division protein ZapE [Aquamicrobium segne]|uniref:Cell division protein ZapE n=1 Tax=Aquamicrobium segne TaxID=469547 RepID=A0ABW0GTP8_9HYPH